MESTAESSWLAIVEGGVMTNGEAAIYPVGSRFIPACTASGVVVFLFEVVVFPSPVFKVRGFFNGVDKDARPSQRDRFEGGVVVGVGIPAPEFGLGK